MRQMANFNKDSNGVDNEELEDIGELVGDDYSHEYENLNSTIDELNSCLDNLERQNDDLYAKLQSLLEDSRQARQELETTPVEDEQQQQVDTDEPDSSDSDAMEAAGYTTGKPEQNLQNVPESFLSEAINSVVCETTAVSTLGSDTTADVGTMSQLNSDNSQRIVPAIRQGSHGLEQGVQESGSKQDRLDCSCVHNAAINIAASSDQQESLDDHSVKDIKTKEHHR